MDEKSIYTIFNNLFGRTSKVLFIYDINAAAITFLNVAFSYLWNRSRESVISDPALLLETIHPEDKDFIAQEYQELVKGAIKFDIECRILQPDNTVSWILINPQLVTDEQGTTYIAGLVDDITAQKDNVNNLHKFASKKNSILEILSHDLAGPLANIQSLAELLTENTKSYQNKEINHIISIIQDSCGRSINLIREFVQQEFLESAEACLVKRRENLVQKMQEVIEQYQDGENHIQKEFRFTTSSDQFYVHIDQDKFMQAINNLLSNAIKFTHDNGVISIDLSEGENSMLIKIQDNGIGIPQQFHDELFDKFTRARREGLRGEPSTGLGMSIIKTIVGWHQGKIWFESEENVGTTFYIELPKEN